MGKTYNNIKTVMLLGLLTSLVVGLGGLVGGTNGLIIAFVLATVMNAGALLFGKRIALMSLKAQPVGPGHELYETVARLAQRANMPVPEVYVSPIPAPNAMAVGMGPKSGAVVATEGLLRLLDRNEVAGVMAHELAHLKHRDSLIATVAATISGAITAIGYMMMWGSSSRENSNPLLGLLVILLGPLAAGIVQMAISRSREFNADTAGAEICGDPMYLATALEKVHVMADRVPVDVNPSYNNLFIVEPRNLVESMSNLFRTHPKLEDRLVNLIGRPSTGRVRTAA